MAIISYLLEVAAVARSSFRIFCCFTDFCGDGGSLALGLLQKDPCLYSGEVVYDEKVTYCKLDIWA